MQKELISELFDSFLIFTKIGTALDISFANITRGRFTPLGTFLLSRVEQTPEPKEMKAPLSVVYKCQSYAALTWKKENGK